MAWSMEIHNYSGLVTTTTIVVSIKRSVALYNEYSKDNLHFFPFISRKILQESKVKNLDKEVVYL